MSYENIRLQKSCRLPGFNISKNETSPHVLLKDFVYCIETLIQRICFNGCFL